MQYNIMLKRQQIFAKGIPVCSGRRVPRELVTDNPAPGISHFRGFKLSLEPAGEYNRRFYAAPARILIRMKRSLVPCGNPGTGKPVFLPAPYKVAGVHMVRSYGLISALSHRKCRSEETTEFALETDLRI